MTLNKLTGACALAIATMLGAITIARAVNGDPLADEILQAVREDLLRN